MRKASAPARGQSVGGICRYLVVAGLLLATACKSSAERQLAQDVAHLSQKIRQLRDAPHNAKEVPLQVLEQTPCHEPAACELKQLCVQAYVLHVKATQASLALREALRSGEDVDQQGAIAVLELSEANLERARDLMSRCLELETELTLKTQ